MSSLPSNLRDVRTSIPSKWNTSVVRPWDLNLKHKNQHNRELRVLILGK